MTAKNHSLLIYPVAVYAFGLSMTLLFPWQPDDDRRYARDTSRGGAAVTNLNAANSVAAPAAAQPANGSVTPVLAAGTPGDLSVCTANGAGHQPGAAAGAVCGAAEAIRAPQSVPKAPVHNVPAEAPSGEITLQQSL